MPHKLLKILFVCLMACPFSIQAQQATPIQLNYVRKKIIDRAEFIAGPNVLFPNDHGWSDYIYNNSQNHETTYVIKSKIGYFFGVGIARSIGDRFEIQGRFSKENKRYFEEYLTRDGNGSIYSESTSIQKNDYLSFSLIPTFFANKKKNLLIFVGLSYSYLTNSTSFGETYLNGQHVGSARINTIDGFCNNELAILSGLGYTFPLSERLCGIVRAQGSYGLTDIINQNQYKITGSSLSLSFSISYSFNH